MSLAAIKKSITKAQRSMVGGIAEDSEVFEVELKYPFINLSYDETLWVFGKHHLDYEMTVSDMVEDLQHWLSGVSKGE